MIKHHWFLTGNGGFGCFKFPTQLHKPYSIGRTDASVWFDALLWTRTCPWSGQGLADTVREEGYT